MKSELTSIPIDPNYEQMDFQCLKNLKAPNLTSFSSKIKKIFKKRVQIRNLGT